MKNKIRPNRDSEGDLTMECKHCVHVETDVGIKPCRPEDCEVAAILQGTFQHLASLDVKRDNKP